MGLLELYVRVIIYYAVAISMESNYIRAAVDNCYASIASQSSMLTSFYVCFLNQMTLRRRYYFLAEIHFNAVNHFHLQLHFVCFITNGYK